MKQKKKKTLLKKAFFFNPMQAFPYHSLSIMMIDKIQISKDEVCKYCTIYLGVLIVAFEGKILFFLSFQLHISLIKL